nr:TonB-dependent receptor [Sphingobium subterraneum]
MGIIASSIALTDGFAQTPRPPRIDIDVPAQPLLAALAELSRETGISIGTEGSLPLTRANTVHGHITVGDALSRMLAGSGLAARHVGPTAWRIERMIAKPLSDKWMAPALQSAVSEIIDPAPIIVTATKRDIALLRLPRALSIVQIGTLQGRDPGTGTAGVAEATEGLAMTALGPGRNRMFLRGVADSPFNGDSQSTVAIMLDDTRLTYSAPDPDLRLVDIERVELLKGPQGSLYGSGALGGVYHIVTHRAVIDETSATASAGVSTVSGGGTGYSGTAVANIPLLASRAALRTVVYFAQEPGWIDTGPRRNTNRLGLLGGRMALGVETSGGWRADLTGQFQLLEAKDSQYVYASGARTRPAQQQEPHDNDLSHFSSRIAGRVGAADLVLASGVTWHEVRDSLDATIGADSFGLLDPALLIDTRRYRLWDSEAHLAGHWGLASWLIGVSHIQARQHVERTLVGISTTQLAIENSRRVASDSAVFADITVPVGSSLDIEAGARLFRGVISDSRATGGATDAGELRKTGLTPSIALSWHPGSDNLLFVRYGSASRQGGLENNSGRQPKHFAGDELATLEAGWRQLSSGGRVVDISSYFTWWDDMQSDELLPNGITRTRNAGRAQIIGLEGAVDQPLGNGWKFTAGATVQDARLVRNNLGTELRDRRLPVIPQYTIRGSMEKTFRVTNTTGAVKFGLRYLGPARLSFDPALDRPMGRVLDSRIEVHFDLHGWTWGIVAENIQNGHDDSFAFGNTLRAATMSQYIPQQPRELSLTLACHF